MAQSSSYDDQIAIQGKPLDIEVDSAPVCVTQDKLAPSLLRQLVEIMIRLLSGAYQVARGEDRKKHSTDNSESHTKSPECSHRNLLFIHVAAASPCEQIFNCNIRERTRRCRSRSMFLQSSYYTTSRPGSTAHTYTNIRYSPTTYRLPHTVDRRLK